MAIKKENRSKPGFGKITISLASPDAILDRSYGEVLKPETINYRTYNLSATVYSAKKYLVR